MKLIVVALVLCCAGAFADAAGGGSGLSGTISSAVSAVGNFFGAIETSIVEAFQKLAQIILNIPMFIANIPMYLANLFS